MERMSKPKFIKEIEKFEGKERAKCGRWYIRVYGELDHKPMVELESLEIVVKELHKLEEENKKLREKLSEITMVADDEKQSIEHILELEEENKKLKEKNEKLEEDNINLISFNEHYSPDVIVKYGDRYETAYNEECIENAKLCDKMRRLEEENKKLKEHNGELIENHKKDIAILCEENKKLKEKLNKAGLEEYGFFNEY